MPEDLRLKVLDFIRQNGPVLPVQISKTIGSNILFAGAVLSELVNSKAIMISTAKIGGSPVYYIKGQEEKLQVLYNGLPLKEKEAFNLLKEKKILRDKILNPAIRVALRQIRDFAVPFKANISDGEEIFWKWYLTSEEEIKKFIIQPEEIKVKQEKKEIVKEVKVEKKAKEIKDDFLEQVNSYLIKNNIKDLSKEIIKKNKEIDMLVKVPSGLGHLDFFLKAKDKKRISDADLSLAYHKGQSHKIPVLFLSTGNLTKKAAAYLEKNLKGYLVFKQFE